MNTTAMAMDSRAGHLATLIVSLCLVPLSLQAQSTPAGKITNLSGKAQIFTAGKWINAQVGAAVYAESSIQTGYNSKAIVLMRNGAQISLKPNTTISFNQFAQASQGSSVEVELVNGAVTSFIPKADEGKTNVFKVRSATAVAGVRGSFMSARRHGSHFSVKALHSPAFMESAPAATEQDLARKSLLVAVAQKEGLAIQAEEAKACLAKPEMAGRAADRLRDAQTKTTLVDSRVSTLRLVVDQQQASHNLEQLNQKISEKTQELKAGGAAGPGENNRADVQAMREEIRELKSQAETQNARVAGLTKALAIAEGNSAKTEGQRLVTPFQAQLTDARPHQAYMPGQTRMEGQFFFTNFDNQAGMGNDFQRLFNNINRLNRPVNLVVPSIRKF